MRDVRKGDVFRHFKGNMYEVVAIARDCEDLKEIVVYRNIDKGDVWTRPLDNFLETVTRDGKTFYRFEKQNQGEKIEQEK